MTIEAETGEKTATRQGQILAAALRVFLKFGYDRTGMAEIAAAAALSRAALYHYFSGKEEVVLALLAQINARTLRAAAGAAHADEPFETRLWKTLDARLGANFRLLRDSPHRAELTDITHRITGEANLDADRRYLAIVETVFAEADAAGKIDLRRARMTAPACAELTVLAAKGLMAGDGDGDAAPTGDFEGRLRDLVRLTALALTP